MDARKLRASTKAPCRRSADSTEWLRRAAAYSVESLERRVLLSSAAAPGGDADFLNRFHSHDLTPAELEARDWVSLNWNGERVYASENEWIVRLDLARGRGADTAGLIRRLGLGAAVDKTLGRADVALVDVPAGVGFQHLAAGLSRAGVYVNVEPNVIATIAATPNDPDYPTQWHYHNTGQDGGTPDADVDAPEAWDLSTGSASVVAAVIDTGIDYNHQDLSANMWRNTAEINNNGLDDDSNGIVDDYYGADFINDDGNPMDDHGHGTHVGGTIAAVGNNSVGVTGMAWTARLMAVKVFDSGGFGTTADVVDGLNYVIGLKNRGINVKATNNSYGVPSSFELEQAVQTLSNLGVLFVAAAGNDFGNDNDVSGVYPANYVQPNVISVAATDRFDQLAFFSNIGVKSVHLAAPGHEVYSTYPGNSYGYNSGTSMASPHVVGAAVLGWSYNPSADMAAVKGAILQGADRLDVLHGITQTGARLNARGTLDLLRAPRTVTGTSSNDTITVQPTSGVPGNIDIVLNSVVQYSGPAANVSWLRLFGMDGNDTITVNSAITIRVWAEGGNGNDNVTGGGGGDFLYGNEGIDTVNGNGGGDRLDGGSGADTHRGDAGNDDLVGGVGNDTYVFGAGTLGTDAITTEAANADVDTIDFTNYSVAVAPDITQSGTRAGGSATLNQANLVLYVSGNGTQVESVKGTNFNDTLTGNTRNNTLTGNGGNDLFNAGPSPDGSDTYIGGGGTDTADYGQRFNNLTLSLEGSPNDGESGELDNISGDVETVKGGEGNDTINGNSYGNFLYGNGGDDWIYGSYGDDYIEGNAGADRCYGEDSADSTASLLSHNDTIKGGTGNDILRGGYGSDVLHGEDNNDSLYGGASSDSLYGGDNNDNLFGGYGNDTLNGGQGVDNHYGEWDNDFFDTHDPFFIESDFADGGPGSDIVTNSDPGDVLVNM